MHYYKVYKNAEQLETITKEMNGKNVSSEVFKENGKSWSWIDIIRQNVREAAASDWKHTIADSGKPCSSRTTATGSIDEWNQQHTFTECDLVQHALPASANTSTFLMFSNELQALIKHDCTSDDNCRCGTFF